MGDSPPDLGSNLLIVISNTPGSLAMVTAVVRRLSDPGRADISLAHYLEPVLWADRPADRVQTLERLFRQEGELLVEPELAADNYFEQSRSVLRASGVSDEHIHVETTWNNQVVAANRVALLAKSVYSTIVIARHHNDILCRLLGTTLSDLLGQYHSKTILWVLDS